MTPPQTRTPDPEAAALTFARAHHRWLCLSEEPQSWKEPIRRRALAAAFLEFHAAKLALADDADAPTIDP